MQQLGKVQTQTSWLGATNTLNNNSDTLYEAITQLENATIKNAGYFLSQEALESAVPNPKVGMTAFIYDAQQEKYVIWEANAQGFWEQTDYFAQAPNISSDEIRELQSSVDEVIAEQSLLTNDVLTNRNDIEELQTTVNTHNTKFSLLDDDIEALQQDKQDKLAHYTEEDENATIATRETISLHTEQQVGTASISIDATTSEVEMSSTNHNSEHARVLLNNGNISIDADVKVSMSCDRGETVIEDVVGTIKEIVDYMAKDETDDDQINVTLNQHEASLGELANSVQMLQDETEDLQSMRDTIDMLGTYKADKSALEAIDKEVEKKQDILEGYREYPSKGAVEIYGQEKVSMSVDYHENISEVSTYYEDSDNGAVPIARIESTYESGDYAYVETRGDEVNIYGDYVNVNGFDLMQTIEDVATLNMRVYELGDFPKTGDAENAAKAENICKNRDISIIRYTVNDSSSHIILQDVNEDFTQQVLYYGGHTYIRHLGAHLNANWRKTNPTNIKYNQDSHRIALMHMVNQYSEDYNNIDWVELPTATTTKDGLMTKEQVVELGKLQAMEQRIAALEATITQLTNTTDDEQM